MRCAYSSITCPADDAAPWHACGDVVAVVETPALLRVLVGDVMGHGPLAGETAAEVRRAFGQFAAHEEDAPQVIACRLDRLVAGLEERGHREEFVTAQFVDVPRDREAGAEPAIVCCGHPPPLLLRDGGATFLDEISPAPPLGLLDLTDRASPWPCPLDARPGDTMLLYTDGVTEARSATGATYPLAERAATVSRELTAEFNGAATGTALIEALKTGLTAHIGGKLRDDATLMYLQFADEPSPGPVANRHDQVRRLPALLPRRRILLTRRQRVLARGRTVGVRRVLLLLLRILRRLLRVRLRRRVLPWRRVPARRRILLARGRVLALRRIGSLTRCLVLT